MESNFDYTFGDRQPGGAYANANAGASKVALSASVAPPRPAHDNTRIYQHWFAFRAGIGKMTKNHLIDDLGFTPEQIFHMSEKEAAQYIRAKNMDEFIASQNLELTKRDLEWLDRNGKEQNIRVIFDTDEDYPMRLQAIPDRPFGLYVKGRLPEDDLPSIAMVGARDATPYGIEAAKYFSRELAEMGVQIISGLARGIDSCSHKGALQCPYGSTFAVLGSGIDVVYPRTNRYIYDQMAEQGGVISEYLPGTQPLRYNFPNRNRIISGLSDGVFIIEARKKSGTMITADQATEQGKDVFCLPGRYYDSLNFGCMDLINNGAKLVYEPRQIFDEIGAGEQLSLALSQVRSASELGPALPPDSPESYLLKFLSNEPHDIDYLVAKSHMSVTQVLTTLTNLEILGIAMTQDRRHFSIKTR